MEIIVCIKQVADDSIRIGLNTKTGLPATEAAAKIINAFDTYALEMAVRCKEAYGGTVTVISVGDESVRESLKNALAVGADQARLICDPMFEGSGTAAIASILCAAIEKLEAEKGTTFDLIFFGKESTDYSSGQMGSLVAETLHRGLATSVIAVELENDSLKIKKETEDGYLLLSASTPAVLTVEKPDYEQRYATIKSKLAARKAVIPVMRKAELPSLPDGAFGTSAASAQVTAMREPPKRAAGHRINEASAKETVRKLVDELFAAGVL